MQLCISKSLLLFLSTFSLAFLPVVVSVVACMEAPSSSTFRPIAVVNLHAKAKRLQLFVQSRTNELNTIPS
ncbi:hypothetical protein KCU93_g427, partial [Aureobasidium melanogenum]